MMIFSSQSLIFEVKSTGSEVALIHIQRLGLGNVMAVSAFVTDYFLDNFVFRRLPTSSEVFGRLRESSEMFVSSSKNPGRARIKISRLLAGIKLYNLGLKKRLVHSTPAKQSD